MKDTTKEAIKWIIDLYIKTNPDLHSKSTERYLYDILTDFKNIPDEMILEGIQVSNDKRLELTKNIMYFRGVVMNLYKEREKKKELESKNSTLPTKIVY